MDVIVGIHYFALFPRWQSGLAWRVPRGPGSFAGAQVRRVSLGFFCVSPLDHGAQYAEIGWIRHTGQSAASQGENWEASGAQGDGLSGPP
jgi:hypothetical protein